jgi:hypothetical protein
LSTIGGRLGINSNIIVSFFDSHAFDWEIVR